MSSVEITITKMHLIYTGAVVGFLFLGVILFWVRRLLKPILLCLTIVGLAGSTVTWQVRKHFDHKEFLQTQVAELPPDFRTLYNAIENSDETETRLLAVSRFVYKYSGTDKITPFQYDAFLDLADRLSDEVLRATLEKIHHPKTEDICFAQFVQFGFELE